MLNGHGISSGSHASLAVLKEDCLKDPMALEVLNVSVIAAGSDAWQKEARAPIDRFEIPFLFQEGGRELVLGAAFTVVSNCIHREVIPRSFDFPGDFCPLIAILVDRSPSDDWVEAASLLLNRTSPRIGSCLTLLAGSDVRKEDFHRVPRMNPVYLSDVTCDTWKQGLRWIDE